MVNRAFHRKINLADVKLPVPVAHPLSTQVGMTMSQLLRMLNAWAELGKQPFTLAQLNSQFAPDSPLSDAFKALIGDHGARWDDHSLTPEERSDQVVPCQLAEVVITQLNLVKAKLEDPDDLTDYGAVDQAFATHSRALYAPY